MTFHDLWVFTYELGWRKLMLSSCSYRNMWAHATWRRRGQLHDEESFSINTSRGGQRPERPYVNVLYFIILKSSYFCQRKRNHHKSLFTDGVLGKKTTETTSRQQRKLHEFYGEHIQILILRVYGNLEWLRQSRHYQQQYPPYSQS